MDLTLAQCLALGFAGLLYGFSKTGIVGMGALVVPVMLYFFTPGQSLGIALPLLIFADVIALTMLRKSVSWRQIILAVPWSTPGVLLGWRILAYAQSLPGDSGDTMLRRLIAGIMVLVVIAGVAVRFARNRRPEPEPIAEPGAPSRPISWSRYIFASAIAFASGCITMLANNSGPSWIVYLMLFRLDKFHFLGTAAWLFFIQNVFKLPFTIQLGYINMDTVYINLFMAPIVVVGLFFGRWILNRVSQKWFDNVVQAIALLGALYLLYRT